MKRYRTVTLPAAPASTEEADALRADGYAEARSGDTLVFQKAVGTSDALEDAVGVRAASSIRAGGIATLAEARAADPGYLAEIPGVGPATIEKLA